MSSGAEYVTHLLEGAIPKEELEEMMRRIYSGSFHFLLRLKKDNLKEFLKGESDETVAIIVKSMVHSSGNKILQSLPLSRMTEILDLLDSTDVSEKRIDKLIQLEKDLVSRAEIFSN